MVKKNGMHKPTHIIFQKNFNLSKSSETYDLYYYGRAAKVGAEVRGGGREPRTETKSTSVFSVFSALIFFQTQLRTSANYYLDVLILN